MTTPTTRAPPNLEDSTEYDNKNEVLLNHLMKCVLPTISPIIESGQHCSVRTDLILAALPSNSTYLHCCLRVAAQHLKSHTNTNTSAADIDSDIKHHYCLALEALVETLKRDEDDHEATLEAVLGLILFQSAASRYDDLHDVSWHQYFGVAVSLAQELGFSYRCSFPLWNWLRSSQQSFNPDGFDRNVAWVYLIGGSISVLGSPIRAFFEDRLAQFDGSSKPNTMGRLATVLHEVWLQNDNLLDVSTPGSTTSEGGQLYIHWREVMESKGWDFLFI
ncbi:hypothetical protein FOQG_17179 [Fusarium oxysporum f. sp. raphani 54005]|uniref:Uncharacterized protein n=2 Tax=Fusarium oxysporum TaxID=5507 RepID=X0B8N7_FUSOX|nr:hypothetical protein FOMG_17102 [Fusarium oxysporum f. sp. melonis 26406]EXK78131.1 hypothetical protein FOQG_17179 [Fusarium oxysporum f. sp. raphani 54005]